jgi:hypothetical protein
MSYRLEVANYLPYLVNRLGVGADEKLLPRRRWSSARCDGMLENIAGTQRQRDIDLTDAK